jgi:hypothetical protein
MTAAAILARAVAAGVTVQADGGSLRLVAAAPPSPDLLHDLAGAKTEVLDLLAERAAIIAEPRLPPVGTPERSRLEGAQRATVAGLLAASERRDLTKPKVGPRT